MSKLQRSPVKSPGISEAHSEPDVASVLARENLECVDTTSRANKRIRYDDSFLKPTEIDELKEMLLSWKSEQAAVLQEHSTTLKTIVSEIAVLKTQSLQIQKTNSEIEKAVEWFNQSFEEVQLRIDSLEKERTYYKQAFESLENKLQDIELRSRSACIEIRNVPLNEKETAESLSKIVLQIASKVQMDMQPNGIRDVYRLPGKPGAVRPIIAEFSTIPIKMELTSLVRSYNNNREKGEKLNSAQLGLNCENRPIYVSEYMSPSVKKLYFLAREFASQNNYKFCWCKNNKIFLRKIEGDKQIFIKSERCFEDLKKPQ